MNPYNIVSGAFARRLTDKTKTANIAHEVNGPYTYTLRHCTVKCERSGGAVVTAQINRKFDHHSYLFDSEISRNLKPGYSMRSLINAIGRCRNEIVSEHERRIKVERFYKKMVRAEEPLSLDDISAIVEIGENKGFTSHYTDMTDKDISYWSKVFLGVQS